jgi:hypothetical protein
MKERHAMTPETVKFMFNRLYRHIASGYQHGMTFGELLEWAAKRKIDDDTFMDMLDTMEKESLVVRRGETYLCFLDNHSALELAKHQRQA